MLSLLLSDKSTYSPVEVKKGFRNQSHTLYPILRTLTHLMMKKDDITARFSVYIYYIGTQGDTGFGESK